MRRWILVSMSLGCSSMALAGTPTLNVRESPIAEMLSGVALNAADPEDRTVTIPVDKSWSKLRFGIQFTRSAATNVTAQFTCSYDGTTYYRRTSRSCASGTCTLYELSDTNPQTSSLNFEIEYEVKGCHTVKILLSGTSAGASDFVTTQSVAIVGE